MNPEIKATDLARGMFEMPAGVGKTTVTKMIGAALLESFDLQNPLPDRQQKQRNLETKTTGPDRKHTDPQQILFG